jgi:hypothetical protein
MAPADGAPHEFNLMKLAGAIFIAILIAATPFFVWLLAISTPSRPGEPEASVVAGGVLVTGLLVGTAYQLFRARWRRRKSQSGSDAVRHRPTSSLGFWGTASAAGVGLISQALFPQILGLDIALVGAMLLAGLLLPGLPRFLVRIYQEAPRKAGPE